MQSRLARDNTNIHYVDVIIFSSNQVWFPDAPLQRDDRFHHHLETKVGDSRGQPARDSIMPSTANLKSNGTALQDMIIRLYRIASSSACNRNLVSPILSHLSARSNEDIASEAIEQLAPTIANRSCQPENHGCHAHCRMP